jgi:hypothetical protein
MTDANFFGNPFQTERSQRDFESFQYTSIDPISLISSSFDQRIQRESDLISMEEWSLWTNIKSLPDNLNSLMLMHFNKEIYGNEFHSEYNYLKCLFGYGYVKILNDLIPNSKFVPILQDPYVDPENRSLAFLRNDFENCLIATNSSTNRSRLEVAKDISCVFDLAAQNIYKVSHKRMQVGLAHDIITFNFIKEILASNPQDQRIKIPTLLAPLSHILKRQLSS